MNDNSEKLEKIYIDLPNHWAIGGESLWARAVGDDLYEIQNIPFSAYNLNFLDVVKAKSEDNSLKPEILHVITRGGHRTLRLLFEKGVEDSEQLSLLTTLEGLNAICERANNQYVAISAPSEADYNAVCDQLCAWEKQGILSYETCEARVPNSFDDKPSDGFE